MILYYIKLHYNNKILSNIFNPLKILNIMKLLEQPIYKIIESYKGRKISPLDITKLCLEQIEKYNKELNAFSFLDKKTTLKQAKESEKRWKDGKQLSNLDGIPVTIKDWFHCKGWPTRYGSKTSSPDMQSEDSPCVARLREAGAIFIGKTTLPEYGHKGVTHSPLNGITRNPWNIEKTCGGSSGGAAVAAATGMGFLNLGSDAGGSIRIPASFSGVFGFKPSPRLVPSYPLSSFSHLSSIGSLTRRVDDTAIMLDIITLPDSRKTNALTYRKFNFFKNLKLPKRKLRIAYTTSINRISVNIDIKTAIEKTVKIFEPIGDIEEININTLDVIDIFNKHWMAIASKIVAEFNIEEKKLIDKRFILWADRGDRLSKTAYRDARNNAIKIEEYFNNLFKKFDILIMPTTAMTAFNAGVDMPLKINGEAWDDWSPFTYSANLAKLPATSLPIAMDKNNLPIGLQIIGGNLQDNIVLQAAKHLEQEVKFESWLETQEN